MSTIEAIHDDEFEQAVLQSELPVLVDFWAAWCGPCKMLNPILEAISPEYEGRLKIFKMDVDANKETPKQYSVLGIPTLMIFKEGKVIANKSGALTKSQLSDFINSWL